MILSLIDSDDEKVDLLNSFLTSDFTEEDLRNIPTFNDRIKQKEPFLANIDFSNEDVKIILSSLNPILPGGGGCLAPPLRFFAHNSEKEKENSTKFGDIS